LKRYRQWLRDYFKPEFSYEPSSFVQLGKLNDANSYKTNNLNSFDLIVRVDKMTQMPQASPKKQEEMKVIETSPNVQMSQLTISDMTGPSYFFIVPQTLIPEGMKEKDVIKISKAGYSKS
jgi:hypothetical protein